jgi:hypothetical protein
MLARCPSCRNTFSTDHPGRQVCPACGKALFVPEAPPAPEAEIVNEPQGTPWERRAELGFFSAWWATLQQALLEPGKLFASARLDRGAAQLGFAVLTAGSCSIVGQLLGLMLRGNQELWLQRMMRSVPDDSPMLPALQSLQRIAEQGQGARAIAAIVLAPLFALIFVYVNAAVTHGVAVLLRQSKRGFPATFAACAYACAPLALAAVPACGGIIGCLWLIVLTGVGMKITHGISSGGAAATTAVPYLACCCLLFLLSFAAASALTRGY